MRLFAFTALCSVMAVSAHAAEDAQYICGDAPCKLVYSLSDNYAIRFDGKADTHAAFSEGVLLIPADGVVKGEPPKLTAQDEKLDMSAMTKMAKTARELMESTGKPEKQQHKQALGNRGSSRPDIDPNYDAPFELSAAPSVAARAAGDCVAAKNALLDVAMTNVLMRAGDNNPFLGAAEEVKTLHDACGADADTQMGELEEQINLMRTLHTTQG